jgi:pimeloyl-ACP methyl ester carboxylesterase
LTGGPGGSAIATANLTVAKGINAERDVVFVDQRDTLHAQPRLVCPEIDTFQREALNLPTTDPATAENSDAATRVCRERLAREGVNLAAYDTTQNAADIADLRVALGIEQWNVRGVSYGTDLALQLLPAAAPVRPALAGASWAIESAGGLGAPLLARLTADGLDAVDEPARLAARVR